MKAAIALAALAVLGSATSTNLPCEHDIYCFGDIIHTVNRAHLFVDSKTFVDMKMKYEPNIIKSNYDFLIDQHGPGLTPDQVRTFVDHNFECPGSELEPWAPDDWQASPRFLTHISDLQLREFGSELNSFWKELGRKMIKDVSSRTQMYSIIPVPNPVIVPGGRFIEFYYWDQYWILKGLLHSEMYHTVRGMLENFYHMVNTIGFIPNGGRIYYQRSQPPLLISMVKDYVDATGDQSFLTSSLDTLEKEFDFWIKNRLHTIRLTENGVTTDYQVARYNVELINPRPEAYNPDYELVSSLPSLSEQNEVLMHLKTAAESGIDFGSRWFIPDDPTKEEPQLIDIKARYVIPVDLNALIYRNARILEGWFKSLGSAKEEYYRQKADQWQVTINKVFWNETEGVWFDYVDMDSARGHNVAFYPSNILPLILNITAMSDRAPRVVDYLKRSGVLEIPGGVPSSMLETGQQWDYPNGWAPHVHWFIEALENSGHAEASKIAQDTAQKWISNNFLTYHNHNKSMFEKYDVENVGSIGGGGEYETVVGFGWTNGVVLDLLHKYGRSLKAPERTSSAAGVPALALSLAAVGALANYVIRSLTC